MTVPKFFFSFGFPGGVQFVDVPHVGFGGVLLLVNPKLCGFGGLAGCP